MNLSKCCIFIIQDKSRQTASNLMEKCRRESVSASFNQLRQCITKNIQTEKGESSQEHFQYMEPSKRQSLKPCYDQLRSSIPKNGEEMSRMDILKTTIAYIRVLKARREARQKRLAIVRRHRALNETFSKELHIVEEENDETAFAALMRRKQVLESPFSEAEFDFY
ncbi:hypothetical protein CEXT_803751 [Caerostris extrusa]|uniref:BHLH domain-containing protein n=1 Tax=Caerostris extrusa TaxID=172846 RepID=A0AAV4T6U8_CAEEX|nr:hypothetical protein CEXT_803751 [Caerostris extrusa]